MSFTRNNIHISFSLVCLTLMIIFIANGMGLIPDKHESYVRERVNLSENLAVQFSAAIQERNINIIHVVSKSIIKRNSQIQSILLRSIDGEIISSHGEFLRKNNHPDSTINLIKVPIFKDDVGWGILEVGFYPVQKYSALDFVGSTFFQLCMFFSIFGFVLYFFLVKKVLYHLDPYKVVPARVKKALNAVSDGIVFIGKDERIVLSNKAFEKKMNCSEDELLGKKLSALSWLEFDEEADEQKSYPWVETLESGVNRDHVTLRVQPYNLEPLSLIISSTVLQDNDGGTNGALVSFNDVTEIEKVGNELESMTKFLRHEMNNALVGASGMVSLLEQSEGLSEEDKHLVDRTQRLHQVIKCLLESVREAKSIEASFANENPNPIRLDTLIVDMTRNYSDIYENNDFVLDSDGNELTVVAQEERLIQMLDKLVSNAVEHSDKNTQIIIECKKDKNGAVIKVINQGDPLPEDKDRIFDLFSSFKDKSAATQNQGIGLYVVKLIVEAYGGAVEARDREDDPGAEFIIKLPIV